MAPRLLTIIINNKTSGKNRTKRIVGYYRGLIGEAELGQIPYQAQVRKSSIDKTHVCGGTIVDQLHILTAAHCFFLKNGRQFAPEELEIVVGSIKLNGDGGDRYDILEYSYKMAFNQETTNNDIAVIKVSQVKVYIQFFL